jgi:23S rRNA pseudouridine1911/1915/1917 synthase
VLEQQFKFTYLDEKGQRLDLYIVSCLPSYSRSRLQALVRDGFVSVDGKIPTKPGIIVNRGQQVAVRIPPIEPVDLIPEAIPLKIIYEDGDILVIDKPAGMVVHPAVGHERGTLVHATLAHAPDLQGIGGELRPGIVHRLDKETSGIILVAKNDRSQQWLQNQFKQRQVHKVYWTLVDGHPPTPQGRVEAPIGRDPAHRKKMAIVPAAKGRSAVTEYTSLERFLNHELIEARPITGRTHQIRLHMAFLGCPVAGDTVYGHHKPSIEAGRFFLHATRIEVILPGRKLPSVFDAPLPLELEMILQQMRRRG